MRVLSLITGQYLLVHTGYWTHALVYYYVYVTFRLSSDPVVSKALLTGTTATAAKSTSTATTKSSSAAAVLYGMDALCTAAAMMADKPPGASGEEQESDPNSASTVNPEVAALPAGAVAITGVTVPLSNDVVTYYRPIGPVQIVNKDGSPTVISSVPQVCVRWSYPGFVSFVMISVFLILFYDQ